jgi:GNAT superfamily N-acetyltransferase
MAVIATCRDVVGRAESADWVVRQLGSRSEAEVLDLLRCAGQTGRPSPLFRATDQVTLPPAAWRAGLFVANEPRGVVRAEYATRGAHVEAKLFVDEKWRRQGIGSMLLMETMDWARRGDADTLRFVCERTDWPMRHFAEKFGARLDLVFGQMFADIPLVQQ